MLTQPALAQPDLGDRWINAHKDDGFGRWLAG